MKTLIIGSTGLLGQALVSELLRRGREVKATVRRNSPQKSLDLLKRLDVETIHADIRNKDSVRKALDQVDEVYFTAALFKTWLSDFKEFERINVEGTRNVFEACLEKGIQRIVYTSSHGTICLTKYPRYADESVPVSERQFKGSPYLQSKYRAEQIACQYAKQGLAIIIVNPAGMIGIRDFSNNPTNKYIRLAARGKIPKCYINAYLCLVDSRDVAAGHILAMEKGRTSERYILGGENITYKEYFTYLAQLAEVKAKLIEIPLFLPLVLSYFLEWKASLTSSMPVLTTASVKFLMKRTRYSSLKAQEELGYRFRPIKESIKEVYLWFKKEMSNK